MLRASIAALLVLTAGCESLDLSETSCSAAEGRCQSQCRQSPGPGQGKCEDVCRAERDRCEGR